MRVSHNGRKTREVNPIDMLRDDLTALRRDVAALAGKGAGSIGGYTRDAIGHLEENAKEIAEEAKKQAAEVHERLAEHAGERPLTTIALAAAAGMVGGQLIAWLARRSS